MCVPSTIMSSLVSMHDWMSTIILADFDTTLLYESRRFPIERNESVYHVDGFMNDVLPL